MHNSCSFIRFCLSKHREVFPYHDAVKFFHSAINTALKSPRDVL